MRFCVLQLVLDAQNDSKSSSRGKKRTYTNCVMCGFETKATTTKQSTKPKREWCAEGIHQSIRWIICFYITSFRSTHTHSSMIDDGENERRRKKESHSVHFFFFRLYYSQMMILVWCCFVLFFLSLRSILASIAVWHWIDQRFNVDTFVELLLLLAWNRHTHVDDFDFNRPLLYVRVSTAAVVAAVYWWFRFYFKALCVFFCSCRFSLALFARAACTLHHVSVCGVLFYVPLLLLVVDFSSILHVCPVCKWNVCSMCMLFFFQ